MGSFVIGQAYKNRRQNLHTLSVWLNKHICTHSTLHTNHSTVQKLRGLTWEILHVDVCYCGAGVHWKETNLHHRTEPVEILLPLRNTQSNCPQKLVLQHDSFRRVCNVSWWKTQTNFWYQGVSLPVSVCASVCVCVCVCRVDRMSVKY